MNSTSTRRPVGIAIAIVFLACAAAFTINALILGGWWHVTWPFTAFFVLFGAVGLATDLPRRIRDEKGRVAK